MTFTTPTFIIFLTIVFFLYWQLGRRNQNLLILIASIVFYSWWNVRFIFLIIGVTGIDYLVALALEKTDEPRHRKVLLAVSLLTNLGVLAFFKYSNFFLTSVEQGLTSIGLHVDPFTLKVILPLGISFHTFQGLSYTIDVYRKRMKVWHDPLEYFAFITFFPQLVAGPIERATNLLSQFESEREFKWANAVDGCRQMLWGFFKKMVIADNLATYVNAAYGNLNGSSGWVLLWATYAFAFQIYCDFSGYTDIAIGCARLLDFKLMRNFAYPYFSRDISEFWRRWHISLSTWFRDYLYIPLGGSRTTPFRMYLNIMIVFLVSGFWHGASWAFIVWGFCHGCFFLFTPSVDRGPNDVPGGSRNIPRLGTLVRILLTFHLVLFAWVFFRAASLRDSFVVLKKIALAGFSTRFVAPPINLMIPVAVLLLWEWFQRDNPHGLDVSSWATGPRWFAYYAIVATIILFCSLQYTQFIYFQF